MRKITNGAHIQSWISRVTVAVSSPSLTSIRAVSESSRIHPINKYYAEFAMYVKPHTSLLRL